MTLPRVGAVAPSLSTDERRQRRWELERSIDAGRVFAERLELAGRQDDVCTVRGLLASLSTDLHAIRSADRMDGLRASQGDGR